MVRSQLRRAFGVWGQASSALSFKETFGPKADILVSFLKGSHGDGYPFDGEGAVLAHAFFPGEGIGGDAHFDAEEKWLSTLPEDENEGVNLFAVAAHEIGHSLGLSHSSTPGSLMFPYYQTMDGEEYFVLPKDDAAGIQYLYGSKSSATTTTATTPTTTEKDVPVSSTMSPTRTTQRADEKPEPNICNSSIDAISVIRGEVFIFKSKHFWRLDTNRTVRPGYPAAINRFWRGLPSNLTKVDAVYERPSDKKIVFFSGNTFWLFSGNKLEPSYPKPLTALGLPHALAQVDLSFVWGHNGKTYLFGGEFYWKLDEIEGRVELDYPRRIDSWKGVSAESDAAFRWTDGNTYFFKGPDFWKFNDLKMTLEYKIPKSIGEFWFKCPTVSSDHKDINSTVKYEFSDRENITTKVHMSHLFVITLLAVFMFERSLHLS